MNAAGYEPSGVCKISSCKSSIGQTTFYVWFSVISEGILRVMKVKSHSPDYFYLLRPNIYVLVCRSDFLIFQITIYFPWRSWPVLRVTDEDL